MSSPMPSGDRCELDIAQQLDQSLVLGVNKKRLKYIRHLKHITHDESQETYNLHGSEGVLVGFDWDVNFHRPRVALYELASEDA